MCVSRMSVLIGVYRKCVVTIARDCGIPVTILVMNSFSFNNVVAVVLRMKSLSNFPLFLSERKRRIKCWKP